MSIEHPNYKHARDASDKFDNYFPVLVFSILALAVQTLTWTDRVSNYASVSAISLLFLSGILSLWKLEQVPGFFVAAAEADDLRDKVNRLITTSPLPPSTFTDLATLAVSQDQKVVSINERFKFWYKVQRWAFVVGLGALIFARIHSHAFAACASCGTR